MTVAELIEKLQKFEPETVVYGQDDYDNYDWVDVYEVKIDGKKCVQIS